MTNKNENIWESFNRVLAELGSIEQETPEEAARKREIQERRLVVLDGDVLIERLGGAGIEDFLDGVEWAKNNPAALVNWVRKHDR